MKLRCEAGFRTLRKKYALSNNEETLSVRFKDALKNAFEKTGKQVVVLVDEYDNPLLKAIDKEQEEDNRRIFKSFFAVLKDCDAYTRFVFFTGVTKFSKVSIFSDLNQLQDISMIEKYSSVYHAIRIRNGFFTRNRSNGSGKQSFKRRVSFKTEKAL